MRTRGSLGGSFLVASILVAVFTVGNSAVLFGAEPSPADVFGVDIGTPQPVLAAIAAGSLSCQEYQAPRHALACRGGLSRSDNPPPDSTTFWIVEGRVSRIFELASLGSRRYPQCVAAFHRRVSQIESTLGRPPSAPASEPSWARAMDDDRKLELLAQGQLGLQTMWHLAGRELSVALRADGGRPVLVVGLEPSRQTRCDPRSVAANLMNLFPPAAVSTRALAAQSLAECKVAGAAGALAAAANASEEQAVKVEAVHALGELGPAGLAQLQAISRDPNQGEAAKEAEGVLAKNKAVIVAGSAEERGANPLETGTQAKSQAPEPARPRPSEPVAAAPVAERGEEPSVAGAVPEQTPEARPSAAGRQDATTTTSDDEESEAPEPEEPKGPPDGTVLALTTSLAAGGVWGGGLSLLAQQSSPGVVLLVGSAGAVIGGGTAWGLTHFGLRPSPAQAMWFANSTAWGTLAGLMAWAGTGSDNVKLKWGLLVGGETLGMGLGVLGARQWDWTPSQILFANSLVLGAGLAGAGIHTLASPSDKFKITPIAGYGTAPAMLAAAVLSRYVAPTSNDVHLLTATTAASAWSAGLLAYGLDPDSATRGDRLAGGFLAGIGVGYLGTAALSPWVEISPRRSWSSGAGLLAGNLIGVGSYMIARPEDTTRRPLWASVGGVGLGIGTFIAYPHLRLGEQAPLMSVAGAAYGAGTWGLAMAASNGGPTARTQGGLLALGTAGGMAGLLASGYFYPGLVAYPTTMAGAAVGATAGIGVGKLATNSTGTGEFVGTLVGSAAGFATGAVFSHYSQLHAPDLGASALGAAYGSMAGALVPTLADSRWGGWQRDTQGGLLVGLSAGAFAAAATSRRAQARGVDVGVATVGSALGLGMGVGAGLLWPVNYSQPARIGALAGTTAGMAGALLLERPLHLDRGLGDSAAGLGFTGAALGVVNGVLLAGIVDPSGEIDGASAHSIGGGLLLGGSAGAASGLVLSQYYLPDSKNLATVVAGDALGALLGRGLAMTVFDEGGRKDTAATLVGSLAGLGAVAAVEHVSPFSSTDLMAGGEGSAFGGIVGSLAPTLADGTWGGWRRNTEGGLMLGVGGGALAGAALSHVAGTTPETIAVTSVGGVLGLGMGTGTGMLWPSDYSQPSRIGAVAGISLGMAGSLLLEHPLRLDEGPGDSAPGLGLVGAGIGVAEGILLAAAVDATGEVAKTSNRQLTGGALLGGSAGLASGLVLSKYYTPAPRSLGVTVGGTVLGGLLGRGLMMTTQAEARRDTAGTMAGSLAGATALAITEHVSPLTDVDLAAGAAGMVFGGVAGALAPSLGDNSWGGWQRDNQGGLMLGLSGGALAAAGLAHAADVSPRTLGLGAIGGVDGALTGAGVGLLVDRDAASSQGARIGVVAGAASGLAIGFGLWPRLEFSPENMLFASAASAVGGWTGAWAQVLGHASLDSVDSTKVSGGLLAGAGGTSFLAIALAPSLRVDTDLLGDALLMDAVFSGAGAGTGSLASRRADAPVWGMLGAGTAGLFLGGVLHDSIELEESRGLVAFAALEGLWAGGWLPYVLRPSAEVTGTDHIAGLAAGGLGAAGLSLVASTAGTPSGESLGMAGVGSAIGASLAGGSVLLSDNLHDQRGVGIMLGGTAVGLGLGALLAPVAPLDADRGLHMAGGAGLGAIEGLAFAWAGRSTTQSQFAGSALVGAGIGASLGLASSAESISLNTQQALVASGFSAWGGWVGSFAGAYANRDSHEVVLGGLAAANVGFLAGYGALRYDLIEPRDFGWLSLAGALGAAVGGGAGAAFSSSSNPRPVLAGLALGPVVGIGAGLIIVPHVRHTEDASMSFFRAPRVASARFELPAGGEASKARTSADVLEERRSSRILEGLEIVQRNLLDVTNWTPVFGSLPPPPGDPNPAPFFMGVSGGLR